ncbi:hypothetical protein PL263_15465 [Methylomonas sp. EFPC3]|uniref:hypothetical protein n=1 Tax=Methylomonas sp. EFPC3 TaxID=3021710 RepID=UPI002415DC8F|nr:hypothetical protein [Methylomonas sp. EFPC3]WFP49486.1 hypothetical protein PL263_15465 [Methylomonas sp. EFPC3]
MKTLFSLLTLLFFSTGANAVLQFDYHGNFADLAGTSFSGQHTFDPQTPDQVDFFAGPTIDTGELRLLYSQNVTSSLLVNGLPLFSGRDEIVLLADNGREITADQIAALGMTGLVTPGTYDTLMLRIEPSSNIYDANGLVSGLELAITAFFDASLFDNNDLTNPNFQDLYNLPNPQYLVFEFNRKLGDSQDISGVGTISNSDITQVSQVPLPGTIWLFGSALAWALSRTRKPLTSPLLAA